MPSRTARRSSTHQSSVAPDEDVSMSVNGTGAGDGSMVVVDDAKYTLASSLLATMMREVIIDQAMNAHKHVHRQRRSQGIIPGGCVVCKMNNCQASSSDLLHPSTAIARTSTPSIVKEENGEDVNMQTSTPSSNHNTNEQQPRGLEMYHNNPLLACLVCSRQVSANRYAQHLASCVGVGKGGLSRTNRKGKPAGNSKIKTALENRKRQGFLPLSGASTPIHRISSMMSNDEFAKSNSKANGTTASDDESIRRPKSNLSSSMFKRSESPAATNRSTNHNEDFKRQRTDTPPLTNSSTAAEGIAKSQTLLGISALAASQPATGSPLNPHRNSKVITIGSDDEEEEDDEEGEEDDDDDDEDDNEDEDEEEGAITNSRSSKTKLNNQNSSSVLSGGEDDDEDEDGSEFMGDESGSEVVNQEEDDEEDSEDGSYVQQNGKRKNADTPSSQSEVEYDF